MIEENLELNSKPTSRINVCSLMQAIFQIKSYDADICCHMMKIYGEANAELMEYVPLSVTFRIFGY